MGDRQSSKPQAPNARIVGISAGVVDPLRTKGGLDVIGTYTEALFARVAEFGVVAKRVDSFHFDGYRLSVPRHADLRAALPMPIAVSLGALARTRTPGVRTIERAVDLYHATDYMVPRLSRTPVVATVYDAIPIARPEWANQRLRSLKNWLLGQSVGNADRVIAISEAAREEVITHYRIKFDRTRVVPLGIDESWFEPIDVETLAGTLARRKLKPGYFLSVGTLQPRKNIGMLLDAYEGLPSALRDERQLVIVGKYGWNAEELRQRLEQARPDGRCIWLRYVPREELPHIYAGAGVFVLPSLAEGFGLPMLEALASGIPAIASDLPSLNEVGDGYVLYVRPNDKSSLMEAMAGVDALSVDESHRTMRRQRAQEYTWRICAERTVGVYDELW